LISHGVPPLGGVKQAKKWCCLIWAILHKTIDTAI